MSLFCAISGARWRLDLSFTHNHLLIQELAPLAATKSHFSAKYHILYLTAIQWGDYRGGQITFRYEQLEMPSIYLHGGQGFSA